MHLANVLGQSLKAALGIALLSGMAFSQAVIERGDFLKIFGADGSHFFIDGTQGNFNIGSNGGPNIYDFSGVNLTPLFTSYNYEVSTIPQLARRFPTGAVTMGESPTAIERNPVFLFGPDTTFTLGVVSVTPTLKVGHYVPAEIVAVFPTVYGSTITQLVRSIDTTFDSGGGVASIDTSSGEEITTIDGYGQLRLSGMQFNCIRMKKEHRGWSGYGDKEFIYMTKEGALVMVSSVSLGALDTGFVTGRLQVLLAPQLVGVDEHETLPQMFSLEQNYPNPFNPSTTIKYAMPAASCVSLSIYNIIGQRVATLVDEVKDAGYHQVSFDGVNLSSGVYIYRMQADKFQATRKFVLLK